MPIEIRELVIRTEVSAVDHTNQNSIETEDLQALKSDILAICKRMIIEQTKKSNFKR